jgi:hypothetical protein
MQRRKYLFSNMSNTAMLLLVAPRAPPDAKYFPLPFVR